MGAYNHIALLYSEDVFGLGANQYVIPMAQSKREPGLLTAETMLMRSKTGSVRRMNYRHPV